MDGCGGFEHFFLLGLLVNYFAVAEGVVLDMLELIIKCFAALYIIRLVLKHNLFISKLIIKINFLGIHIEINSKEKKHPSDQE
ncbi:MULTISPECIES: hypothetical protein [Clostridium]|jgi:hypothetical protein|nr:MULTISPECIES: hypothetical protein [Clostridium]MCI1581753.1 hypothetical protein [Clostridium beijerinckii]